MSELPQRELVQKFKSIFYPESIAIVGASTNGRKIGSIWVKALIDTGFSGNIYPVNPCGSIGIKLVERGAAKSINYSSSEQLEAINDILVELMVKQSKPLVIVLPPGLYETERLHIERKLSQASIPVFPTVERAAEAIVNLSRYSRFQAAIKDQ